MGKSPASYIGGDFSRIDGPLKCSGRAVYSSDFNFPGLLYAVPVCATIASGRITGMDTAKAERMPGVHVVYTRHNIGPLHRPGKGDGTIDEKRPPLSDDTIHYWGQYVALVVADTFEQATDAARHVKVSYQEDTPDVSTQLAAAEKPDVDTERGDPESAFASAPVKVDHTYRSPPETHNPIELHASVAVYDNGHFTLYETTQSTMNHRKVMAAMLGVPQEQVKIIMHYLGSGFGGKLWPWPHALLAAAAARNLERPIKLVVSRKMMFESVGHRTNTQQRMRLGASHDGKLLSLQQDYLWTRSREGDYKENCGEATGFLYSTPNLRVTAGYARRDVGYPTAMRGPGAVPGLYAVESAMDELAVALDMDPVQLRIKNEPKVDETNGHPFSSRHLVECLTTGAEKFGWDKRQAKVGSMRDGDTVLGWGVAACSWMAQRLPAQISVQLNADGSAHVASATQDIGTGTYTVIAQMVAQLTGIGLDRIEVKLGESTLPPGPLSGGSMVTGSMVPATDEATRAAISQLLHTATGSGGHFAGVSADQLTLSEGRVHRKDQAPDDGVPFGKILADARVDHVSGKGQSKGSGDDPKEKKLSIHSYGAHFVEIGWQPDIARLRVRRVVTVIDGGRVINTRTGRNQIEGAIVMGLGMAMLEDTEYDSRNGAPINSNLADYLVASHADTPEIDVTFLDYPDYALNALGARGIGEIGLAGFAAAVTSAVYHATGVRVRDLPVRIEDLLNAPEQSAA
ncbi:xanthine dehydrogenase family protein molybdopterin-binding subunit [Oleiagrimonas sp. C23AA]|uniref:xanthine dehydrogenase family protein molybdopterin-binding subunit n=1 Tax=Oleiagrimonas sp. C23AA TaxID=2719047 RepID=UPI001423458D|nr:xanthine dehydrogenase family protein molybdopterin-binding subunit [Oleiagrimonas sp. C23AA]NII09930.1 xanthine dehydrogenase family protein molybdopterin-binding subunit [Oleiagrimonas sp. C23AA]